MILVILHGNAQDIRLDLITYYRGESSVQIEVSRWYSGIFKVIPEGSDYYLPTCTTERAAFKQRYLIGIRNPSR